jgi:hypothetical protein
MGLDIRIPIGFMFGIIGLLLVVYGLLTGSDPMYARHSLGINVNLWWGAVLLVFGGLMLWFGRKAQGRDGSEASK